MDRQHRNLIEQQCDNLVMNLNLSLIWDKLFEYNIFNKDDNNVPLWQDNLNSTETAKKILLKIRTRGPFAFAKLCRIFEETGHHDQLNILMGRPMTLPPIPPLSNYENGAQSELIPNRNHSRGRDPFENFDLQEAYSPPKIMVKSARRFQDRLPNSPVTVYPMRSKPRGLVLLIVLKDYKNDDYKKRESAIHDEKNLNELFNQMGFKVICISDLTGSEMKKKIEEFSKNPELRLVDSAFIIISGHGSLCIDRRESYIAGIDGEEVLQSEIFEYFSAYNCPNLIGKPKVFIFQTCRGKLEQQSVSRRGKKILKHQEIFIGGSEPSSKNSSVRNVQDIFIANSTLPGYVSYRDKSTGSWFITILCLVFMEHACDVHLSDLFSMIDARLSRCRTFADRVQTTDLRLMGFKHLFLHPGLYEEQ